MYDRLLNRMIELMDNQFIEVYNKFAIQRQNEYFKKKGLSSKEYDTLMLLLSSYIYFKDDVSRFDVYLYKCAFNIKYPEYLANKKEKIFQNIVEVVKMIEKSGAYYDYSIKKFIGEYSIFLKTLHDICK